MRTSPPHDASASKGASSPIAGKGHRRAIRRRQSAARRRRAPRHAGGGNLSGVLLSGITLTISPRGEQELFSASGASLASSQPVGPAAQGSPRGPRYPTPQTLSAAEVAAIAAGYGVPGSLADAVACRESGFNSDLVSSLDARGVMQITPGTWTWIQQQLAGATPLAPASAQDNVRPGALLLASLLEATGGNEELVIAGCFQGLPSDLEDGIEPATRQHVADVIALRQSFGGE